MSHKKVPMTPDVARRIVSHEAKNNGGKIAKNGFAVKAMGHSSPNILYQHYGSFIDEYETEHHA